MSDAQDALKKVNDEMAKLDAKAKSIWTRYELYVVAVTALIAGILIGHYA